MPKLYTRWDLSLRAQHALDAMRAAQQQIDSGQLMQAEDYLRRALAHVTALRRGVRVLEGAS